ncbi:MAG: lipopolysaccharide biosynthesis protein [Methanobacterium sp.]
MNKQIKVGAILSYVSLAITLLTGLIVTPINLRLFGQAEYGLYSLAYTILEALYIFDFGFSNAIVRYVSKFQTEKSSREISNLNAMFLILYAIIGLLAFAAGMTLSFGAEFIFDRGLSPGELARFKIMLMIVAINLGLSFPLEIFNSTLAAREKFIFTRTMRIIKVLVNPAVMITVLYLGFSSVIVLIAVSIVNISFTLINVYYCLNILKVKIKLEKFDFSLFKEIARYSVWIFVARIVDVIYTKSDAFILGAVVNSKAVAVFTVAGSLNNIYTQLTLVLGGLLLPSIVKLISRDISNHELSNVFIRVSRIQFFLAALVLCGFALVGSEFVRIWAGPGYHDAYWVTLMLMTVRFIPIVQMLAVTILEAKFLHAFRAKLYLLVAVFNILISIPLAKEYGVIGCALGTVIGITINTIIMNFYYAQIGLEMKRYFKEVFILFVPMLLLFMLGIGLRMLLNPASLLMIILFAAIFSAFYALVMFQFMNQRERKLVLEPIKRIIKYKVES